MPAAFHLPVAGVDVGGACTPTSGCRSIRVSRGGGYFAYGRRKPGVTFAAAEADVKRVAAQIAAEDPVDHPAYTARLFDLRETVIKDIRPTLLLLFAAAGLLFLITCANAAGLLLARSVARARETAMRVALGAGRGQLAAQYFAEGLLVGSGRRRGRRLPERHADARHRGAGRGLSAARGRNRRRLDGARSSRWARRVVASALSSLAPLWQAARTAPADVLGDGARAIGRRAQPARSRGRSSSPKSRWPSGCWRRARS